MAKEIAATTTAVMAAMDRIDFDFTRILLSNKGVELNTGIGLR